MALGDIGKLVRTKQRALGVNTIDLAEGLGISLSHLSNILHARKQISEELAFKIAGVLGLDDQERDKIYSLSLISATTKKIKIARESESEFLKLVGSRLQDLTDDQIEALQKTVLSLTDGNISRRQNNAA